MPPARRRAARRPIVPQVQPPRAETLEESQKRIQENYQRLKGRRSSVIDERSQQAWRAVRRFTEMLPQLSAFARVLSGNPRARVVLGTQGAQTDGNNIFIMPNIAFGMEYVHQRHLCDRRGPDKRMLCTACDAREVPLFYLYHEVAHIVSDSTEAPTIEIRDRLNAMIREWHPYAVCSHAVTAMTIARDAKGYLDLFGAHNGYLPILTNSLEDARVNAAMFKARPGLKVIFEAGTIRVFNHGIELPSGEIQMWNEQTLNSQIMIGLFLVASGYSNLPDQYLREEVAQALRDPQLRQLADSVVKARSVHQLAEISLDTFSRLNELGYCLVDKCVPPPPIPSLGNPGDSGNGDSSESGEQESNDQQSGDGSPQDSTGDGHPSEGSEGEDSRPSSGSGNSEPAQGDSDSADDDGGDRADGGSGQPGGADDEDQHDAGEGQDAGTSGGTDEESNSSEGDPAGTGGDGERQEDGDSPSGGGSDSASDDVNGGTDDHQDDPSSGEDGPSDGSSSPPSAGGGEDTQDEDPTGDPDGEGDGSGIRGSGSISGPPTDPSDRPHDDPLGGGEGSGAAGDSEHSPGLDPGQQGTGELSDPGDDEEQTSPDGSSESQGEGDLGEDGEDGEDGEHDEGNASDPQDDDFSSSAWDDPSASNAAREQWGREEHIPPPNPYGTPDDVARVVEIFGGHKPKEWDDDSPGPGHNHNFLDPNQGPVRSHTHGDHTHSHPTEEESSDYTMSHDDIEAVQTALEQAESFGDQRIGVGKILKIQYPHYEAQWFERYAPPSDFMPSETVLGRALLEARVAFEANKRAKAQRNLKSGRVDPRVLGRRVPVDDERLFLKRTRPGKLDYFFAIGLDLSGSTCSLQRNPRILRAAFAQASMLSRLGHKFAIYGMAGGNSIEGSSQGRNDVWIFSVKEPDEPWTSATQRKLASLRPRPYNQNYDGHNIEFLRKVLDGRTETDRAILYYTDGEMPAANYNEELVILVDELNNCKKKGYVILGVGINTDSPRQYGLDTVQVESDEDIVLVVRQLGRQLTKMNTSRGR